MYYTMVLLYLDSALLKSQREGFAVEIAIVDDMELDREQVERLVRSWSQRKKIEVHLSLFSSGEAFLEKFKPEQFSIVLLDLYMKGINGMDTAREIRRRGSNSQLVFVTSSDAYAIQGYEVDAANYLLKPVDEYALENALQHCLLRLGCDRDSITVTSNRAAVSIPLRNIIWIEAQRNALLFHTDGGTVKSYMTVESASKMIRGKEQFLICCKGIVVNMDRIVSVGDDTFIMDDSEQVPIRKRGGNQVKQQYLQYIFSQRQS